MTNQQDSMHACPACGLLCDDISGDAIARQQFSCGKAAKFYARVSTGAQPQIAGRAASLTDAVAAAVAVLKQANTPLVAGSSTDVHGARALVRLAQHTGAAMTHMNASSTLRNMKVLQHRGWQTTTLTEVRNRADVILMIGTDVVTHNTRFFDRVVWVDDAMFTDPAARKIIYLGGDKLSTKPGISPDGRAPEVIACAAEHLPEVVATLRALVMDKPVTVASVAGIAVSTLKTLADTLKAAKYATLVWVSKDLHYDHAELTIENITETVVALNQKSRAMGLSMGGSDGDTSVNYAHTWLNGVIIDAPEWESHDAVVWVNSYSPDAMPPAGTGPVIVLGAPDSQFDVTPAVFIPVATPGLDCNGQQFRVDGSVTLPLTAAKPSDLPTLSQVVALIEAQLQGDLA
ncbi:formylmethanofuran dehydrogenase [Methylophilus sp. QUAN]|uniref:formylmethanofuran dehydrogenase n=1 Tax=Methylophilus sp. QUAN TaxID=2781020 RepID=UPI00188FF0EF|nr:formylmethanofuran dehydrogenase [Methylophilus sp. QUAN]MBF4990800.1 formylmethanofuran dehydrogenase [Methylophilus sp. QUAN]